MEAQVKHRVVGSLVLISLAVIILPFWLDGAGLQEHQNQTVVTPEPPVIELAEIETVDPSDTNVIELSPIETVVEPIDSPQVEVVAKPSNNSLLNVEGLPNGWLVQLGSFGNEGNATRLTEKLIKAGFNTHMVPKANVYKVLVGPELDRSEAQALQVKLKSQFKMTGIVIRYEINKP